MIVNQKNQFQQQLTTVREELRKAHEETRRNLLEKTRLLQQVRLKSDQIVLPIKLCTLLIRVYLNLNNNV